MKSIKFNRSDSICWDCEKCGGGCSWSHDLTPVEGWKTKEDYTLFHGQREESYIVKECPLFEKRNSKIKATDVDDEGAVNVILAIVKRANKDYITSYIADFYKISDEVAKASNKTLGIERLGKVEKEIRTGIIGSAFGVQKTEEIIEQFKKNANEVINIMALWMDGTSKKEIARLTGKTEEEIENLIKGQKNSRNYKIIRKKFTEKERV